MTDRLSDTELRVLGVLIEKALTQPAGYPMTLNAVTLGANQKQNREPVVEYGEGDVSAALRTLEHKGLVARAEAAIAARAVRFKHLALEKFKWDKREQAVMAELMLRGRQTAGELRTRASRMMPLPDLPAVAAVLEHLKTTEPPYVEELPREPGRSANRFRHLLGESEHAGVGRPPQAAGYPHHQTSLGPAAPRFAAHTADAPGTGSIPASEAVEPEDSGESIAEAAVRERADLGAELAERMARLEAEVAELKAIVGRLVE